MKRALLFLLLASCDGAAARVIVDDVRANRRADGFVEVAVDVTGVEQTGGDVGRFCVSAHWLYFGIDTGLLSAQPSYFGEQDHVQLCTEGLKDGDKKTLHLVSSTSTTQVGVPLRAQAGIRDAIETKDIDSP